MEIHDLDIDNRLEFSEWHGLGNRSIWATTPTFVPRPLDVVRTLMPPTSASHREDIVAYEGDTMVGVGLIWLGLEDNLTLGCIDVTIEPGLEGRGIEDALLDELERRIPASRTELVTSLTTLPGMTPADHPLGKFWDRRGYHVSSRSSKRSLPWPQSRSALEALMPPTADYRIETWIDGVPEQYRESYGHLVGLIDVDAPSGDVEWEASPVSPDQYAEELAQLVESGEHLVETLAFTTDGDVVAFTSTEVPSIAARYMYVAGTYVHRAHRGHRLGMAVKVANYLRLLEEGYPNPSILTENNDENVWMVGLNEQMGFVTQNCAYDLQRHR